MKRFINNTVLRRLFLSIPLLIIAACSVPPPELSPETFPEPYGEVNVGSEEQELEVTLKKDITNGAIFAVLWTNDGDRVDPWTESYVFTFPCSVQSRWWSVDYTESCVIKITLNRNDSGCIRKFSIERNPSVERDEVTFVQMPESMGDYPEFVSNGKTEYNVKYVNNSSHTVVVDDIHWGYGLYDKINAFELAPSQSQIARTFYDLSPVDILDARYTSLWCSAIPPITCDVTFDGVYGLDHSYFEDSCGEFCLTDWQNYEISGGKIPEEQAESGLNPTVYKWTLIYTFTDADYEYAVVNGTVRQYD